MRIGFTSYGHTDPNDPQRDRNAMLLVNWGIWHGIKLFASESMRMVETIDFSSPLGPKGIRQDVHADTSCLEPVDVLVFQGGVSLHRVRKMQELNPDCIFIEQRESTHCLAWLELMKAAQKRRGFEWRTNYDNPAAVEHDLAEYDVAKAILVPSGFVASTFQSHGLGDKVRYYGPSLIEFWPVDLKRHRLKFDVLHAAQLGIRKGTLEVFDAWEKFTDKHPNSSARLCVAGLPEHGAPEELKRHIAQRMRTLPGVVQLGWLSRENLRKAYGQAHVLLQPSVEDGATMVGPEAAYAGCAIVSAYNAGIDLPHVEVSTVDDIVVALEDLYHDRQLRDAWGQDAHDLAEQKCSLVAYAERVADALEEVLG